LFIPLWVTFVYFPIAHMVWYWAGPDAIAEAAKALAAATDANKADLQAKLDAVNADSGLVFGWGAIDFAGGTVVHINAGIAGLVGALMVGRRTGYGKELMPPHSLVMTMIGAIAAAGADTRMFQGMSTPMRLIRTSTTGAQPIIPKMSRAQAATFHPTKVLNMGMGQKHPIPDTKTFPTRSSRRIRNPVRLALPLHRSARNTTSPPHLRHH